MANTDVVAAVEAALVTIRRRQTRRTLAAEFARSGGVEDRQRVAGAETSQQVLDALEAAEPDVLGVNGVAEALAVDQPRASKLVAAAVAAGLVRREADQADGRRTVLVLTDAGREQLERVHAFRRDRFAAAMDGWSLDEKETFADLLTRFVSALDR